MADDNEPKDLAIRYPNLRPIKAGEVRNPSGRNGKDQQALLRQFLDGKAELTSKNTRRENLILALYTTAIDRRRRDHVAAARVLLSYDLGLPPQSLDVRSPDGSMAPKIFQVRFVAPNRDGGTPAVGNGSDGSSTS